MIRILKDRWDVAVGRVVSMRRHLARNHPFLWQIRLHSLLLVFLVLVLLSVVLALIVPVSKAHVPDFANWHFVIFLFSFLFVLYWLLSYFLLLDPAQMPPTAREPAVLVLIVCSILILTPSYGFLLIAERRVADAFPDLGYEQKVQEFFAFLAENGGDRRGPFRGALPAELASRFPLMTNSVPFQDHYSIDARGVIGPVSEAGKNVDKFKRELVCKGFGTMMPYVLASRKFAMQRTPPSSSAPDADVGVLVPVAPTSPLADGRTDTFAAIYDDYAQKLTYTVERAPASPQAPYCVSTSSNECTSPKIVVTLDCDGLAMDRVERIFSELNAAASSLFQAYMEPMSAADLRQVSSQVFSPFCDVGRKRDDCTASYIELEETLSTLRGLAANERMTLIRTAYGSFETIKGDQATITAGASADAPRSVEFVPKKENQSVEADTAGGLWLGIWFFVVALLAVGIKSFRLVRVPSSNYLFVALIFVPGVLIASYLTSEFGTWLAHALRYLGVKSVAISVNPDLTLLSYFVLSNLYVGWQVTKRQCSRLARTIACFNLFFLIVMSFYLPYMSLPGGETILRSGFWAIMLALAFYFCVIYEGCYALARIARERPQ